MSLLLKLESDLREAIKKKNEVVVRTLRMVKSEIQYEKTKTGRELSDNTIIDVMFKSAKKRKESIEEFNKAGRNDLVEKEAAELKIIETYLPAQMSEDEIIEIVDRKIKELGGITQKDFGRIMGILMREMKVPVDGALVNRILKKKIEGAC